MVFSDNDNIMIDNWISKYIGIPYKVRGTTLQGMDCLGLVELIYQNEFNITLPAYPHMDTVEMGTTSKAITQGKGDWLPLDKPEPGCVILLKICGYPIHMGLVVNDTEMLHSLKGHDSVIESFTGMKWNKRIEGFYHYVNAGVVVNIINHSALESIKTTTDENGNKNIDIIFKEKAIN